MSESCETIAKLAGRLSRLQFQKTHRENWDVMTNESVEVDQSKEPSPAAIQMTSLVLFLVFVVTITIGVCVYFTSGWVLGTSLCLGLSGLTLTGVMAINKFSDNHAQVLTLVGMLMATAGYIITLPGTFHPVLEIQLNPNIPFDVSTDASKCKYKLADGLLICPVTILQK